MAWPVIGAVIGGLGLVSSFVGSRKAAKAAEEQAEEEARLEGAVTREKLAQLRIDERTQYGETIAGYAGGGVMSIIPGSGGQTATGSPASILQEQATAYRRQRDITEEVGATKAQMALTRGENLADKYRYSGYANVAAGISNLLMTDYS
jgi:hypothetical protein